MLACRRISRLPSTKVSGPLTEAPPVTTGMHKGGAYLHMRYPCRCVKQRGLKPFGGLSLRDVFFFSCCPPEPNRSSGPQSRARASASASVRSWSPTTTISPRSEERRVGKECRSRGTAYDEIKL